MKVNHISEADLRKKIDEIYKAFPALKTYDLAEYCCSGCALYEVGRDLGWDAADAWDELQDLLFLLDE